MQPVKLYGHVWPHHSHLLRASVFFFFYFFFISTLISIQVCAYCVRNYWLLFVYVTWVCLFYFLSIIFDFFFNNKRNENYKFSMRSAQHPGIHPIRWNIRWIKSTLIWSTLQLRPAVQPAQFFVVVVWFFLFTKHVPLSVM